jgi:hypothetical protein
MCVLKKDGISLKVTSSNAEFPIQGVVPKDKAPWSNWNARRFSTARG